MKYSKIGIHELCAVGLLVLALLLRLLLASQNWPLIDSDEGTFGLMAMHIAYRGEHPTFLDGYHYMGSLQSHIGAALFFLFGPTLFALRLGIILLIGLFLCAIYILTRTLYSKGLALVILALLCGGSHYVLEYQIHSYGGYPETLLFSTLLFLCALWLAYFEGSRFSRLNQWKRYLVYAAWGCVSGLGLWSDMLIAPFILTSGLLILLFCWRELLRVLPIICILIGLCVGAAPLIRYNLHAAPGEDSLSVLSGLTHNPSQKKDPGLLTKELKGTFQVSVPTITGNPFCPVSELPILKEPNSPKSPLCTFAHSSWSIGYLLLFGSAIALATLNAWSASKKWRISRNDPQARRALIQTYARWLLLASAVITLALYTFSTGPVEWPGIHSRYLIGLLVALPAVIWPLWRAISTQSPTNLLKIRKGFCTAALLGVGIVYLIGTIMTFSEIPTAQAEQQRNLDLIKHLRSLGITHIYTEYWTCDKIAFLSQEQIICGVVASNLQPTHNREEGYYDAVKADPRSIYVFPLDYAVPLLEQQTNIKYRHSIFNGYNIYQPIE